MAWWNQEINSCPIFPSSAPEVSSQATTPVSTPTHCFSRFISLKTKVPGVFFIDDKPVMRGVYVVETTKYQHGLCLIIPTGPDPKALGKPTETVDE